MKKGQPSTLAAIMAREGSDSTTEFKDMFVATQPCTDSLTHVTKLSGQPFGYLRSLWLALVDDSKKITKRSIWGVYQGMRQCANSIASEQDTNLYLCMTACDSCVDGFRDSHTQRQVRRENGLFYTTAGGRLEADTPTTTTAITTTTTITTTGDTVCHPGDYWPSTVLRR